MNPRTRTVIALLALAFCTSTHGQQPAPGASSGAAANVKLPPKESLHIKGALWHQGEADTASRKFAESYEARLVRMFADLRQDLGEPDLPIVVGQLGEFLALTPEKYPYAENVRAAIKRVPAVLPHAGYADSAGLADKGDKLHFSAEGARELGVRFATAMQELQK